MTLANYSGDINGDYIISISDVVILTQFLTGRKVQSDGSAADVNMNSVIDEVDRQILTAFTVGMIVSLPNIG